MKFDTGYMDNAIFDLQGVLDKAVEDLRPHIDEFDTLVGTGFSGGMLIPALALKLNKKFVLIRKETDDSHHGSGRLLGDLGERWIFVDDFVSSGTTRRRVMKKIAEAAEDAQWKTEIVGNYYYSKNNSLQPYTRTSAAEEAEKELIRQRQEELYQEEMREWRKKDEERMAARRAKREEQRLREVAFRENGGDEASDVGTMAMRAEMNRGQSYVLSDWVGLGANPGAKIDRKDDLPQFELYDDYDYAETEFKAAIAPVYRKYVKSGDVERQIQAYFGMVDINGASVFTETDISDEVIEDEPTLADKVKAVLDKKKNPAFSEFTKSDFRLRA